MRVLLAQTDRHALEIFRTALTAAGHEVLTTRTGDQVIRMTLERRPDVVVTELVLPLVDGPQVLQVLRTYEPFRALPIIAVTSHLEPEGEAKALEAGFTGYLALPVEPSALVEAVERAGSQARDGDRRTPRASPPS